VVVKEVELGDLDPVVGPLARHQDLPDQRSDGLDGARQREERDRRKAGVCEARMDALTDRPDAGLAGESGETLDREIGHHLVELAHQPLVRSRTRPRR